MGVAVGELVESAGEATTDDGEGSVDGDGDVVGGGEGRGVGGWGGGGGARGPPLVHWQQGPP